MDLYVTITTVSAIATICCAQPTSSAFDAVVTADDTVQDPTTTLATFQPIKPCVPNKRKPSLKIGEYRLKSKDKSGYCLLANMAAYVKAGDGEYMDLGESHLYEAASSCPTQNGGSGTLVIQNECGALVFELNRANEKSRPVSVSGITLNIQFHSYFAVHKSVKFAARKALHAYRCKSEQETVFRSNENNQVALVLSDVIIEAYRDIGKPDFYQPQDVCAADGPPGDNEEHSSTWIIFVINGLIATVVIGSCIAYYVSTKKGSQPSNITGLVN